MRCGQIPAARPAPVPACRRCAASTRASAAGRPRAPCRALRNGPGGRDRRHARGGRAGRGLTGRRGDDRARPRRRSRSVVSNIASVSVESRRSDRRRTRSRAARRARGGRPPAPRRANAGAASASAQIVARLQREMQMRHEPRLAGDQHARAASSIPPGRATIAAAARRSGTSARSRRHNGPAPAARQIAAEATVRSTPVSTSSRKPAATSARAWRTIAPIGTERLAPRPYGMMQKVQRWSQPCCTSTKARARPSKPVDERRRGLRAAQMSATATRARCP